VLSARKCSKQIGDGAVTVVDKIPGGLDDDQRNDSSSPHLVLGEG
jgi:hypothetical protein